MKTKKRSVIVLCIALVLILAGSILAGMYNSSNGSVTVTRISFETQNGTLSGLLYMPKGASAENPRPTVIVTHGYLNSAEMQDANAIELSRRGLVVLALDQYDHGHSDLDNKVYTGTIDGEEYIRVINQNTEIHPLNHFSKASCRDLINFFYEVFGVPSGHAKIDANNQIWQWKEFFNLVGLVGIFLFLFPFASLLIHGTKFFEELAQPEPAPAPALSDGSKKAKYWITYAINTILPALLVVPVAYKLVGKESFVPFTYGKWFGEPNTNELAAWTLVVGLALLVVFLISSRIGSTEKGTPACWGVKASGRVIWKSVLLAALTVFTAYVILFTNDLIFNTDYRIWVIDMRVFNVQKLLYFVAYFPAWVVFYLVNSLLVNGGNRVEGRPEWRTLLISCIGNIAGIAVLIFIQYHGIIANGTFAFNSMRIVNLFPLVFLIPVGTIVSRRFFKETGNIYAGSLVIAFLYCMMTVANTMCLGTIL